MRHEILFAVNELIQLKSRIRQDHNIKREQKIFER